MIQPGQVLRDRYTIQAHLGQSGAGQTWRAVDGSTGASVVLKVLDFARLTGWSEFRLFQREVELLKSIGHTGVPAYVDDFGLETAGASYLVLVQRYVPGDNLEHLVRSGRRFEPKEIRAILRRLLEILRYVHGLRPPVIHRDIHPRNVVLDGDDKPCLVDFGAAGGTIDASITGETPTAGVIGYVPPEQYLGQSTPASDLYALGMTAVFLLTGRDPSDLTEESLGRAVQEAAGGDTRMVSLLLGLIQPDLAKRIPTAVKALEILRRTTGQAAPVTQAPRPAKDRWSAGGWVGLAAGVVAFLAFVGVPAVVGIVNHGEAARVKRDLPLIEAVTENLSVTGRMQRVRGLIEDGANVDARDSRGRSALVLALDGGHLDVATYLLESGADPLARAPLGTRQRTTALHVAAEEGYSDMASQMLAAGISAQARDEGGSTPLHLAAWNGHLEIARLLMDAGGDPDLPDSSEITPLGAAVGGREPAVARYLLESGATPTVPLLAQALERVGDSGRTEDTEAWESLARSMVEHGCDIQTVDMRVSIEILLGAAEDSHLVSLLLGTSEEVNEVSSGTTALMRASRLGDAAAVDILLDLGADRDLETDEGQTALSLARKGGHLEIARRLTAAGATEVATDASFFAAVEAGDTQAVRAIVRGGVDVNVSRPSGYGRNEERAVDIAIQRGDAALLDTLRDLGATVKLSGGLLLAYAQSGNLAAVRLLVAQGVDPSARSRNGDTALDVAVEAGHVDVARAIRGAGGAGDLSAARLVRHARDGEAGSVRALLALRVPADGRDDGGRSALLEASHRGETETARILLDAGADPDQVDAQGRTPLSLAVSWDATATAELLLARGANTDIPDRYGRTALHGSVSRGNDDVTQALLERGADTGVQDSSGDTPLITAILEKEPRLVDLLISAGCDVNLATKARRATGNRSSPLGIAVWARSRNPEDEDVAAIEAALRAAGARE